MAERFPPDIKERLLWAYKRADEKKITSIPAIAKHFDVSNSAVSQWFNPDNKGVALSRLVDLCCLLDINLVWLLSGVGEPERAKEMTPDDIVLLRKFKRLNDVDRRRVSKSIDDMLQDYEPVKPSFRTGA
jgi:hypothetical protein